MINHYSQSWDLYRVQTENFNEDFAYYLDLCKGHKTLELFAGFGRLTNFLSVNGVDIQAVELESNFSKDIKLPPAKVHTIDVLKFQSKLKFNRIIAAYNSFCLLTQDSQLEFFFLKLNSLLNKNGIASLSYYSLDGWVENPIEKFIYKNKTMQYRCRFDFSYLSKNIAIWIDEYNFDNNTTLTFKYPTRVFFDLNELNFFIRNTDLRLIDIKESYPSSNDKNWKELIFLKK